jgi:hypothetical protein
VHLAGPELEVDAVERHDAREVLGDGLEAEEGRGGRWRGSPGAVLEVNRRGQGFDRLQTKAH